MKTLLEGRTVRILTFIVLAIGVLGILISVPILGLSALGHHGALADVGPAENRNMGIQLLALGLPPLIGGVVLCVLSLLALTWNRRRAHAKHDGPANGSQPIRSETNATSSAAGSHR